MNGAELARALRADPALPHMPIIMLTSVDHMEDGKAFSALGIEAHLSKPARSSLLLETMISVMSKHPAAAPLADPVAITPQVDAAPPPQVGKNSASTFSSPRTTR